MKMGEIIDEHHKMLHVENIGKRPQIRSVGGYVLDDKKKAL
jgi:hypothetical protein